MIDRLAEGLERLGAQALLVVADRASSDPDMGPWVGSAHLGEAFVVAKPGEPPALGYWTPMERDEAASTGLRRLDPEELDVARWSREGGPPSAVLASVLARGLQLVGVGPGRIALAGHGASGVALEACARLAAFGWDFVSGNELVRRVRKLKSAREVAEIRRVAAATGEAFQVVARLLAAAESRAGALHLEGEPLRVERLRREIARTLAGHGVEQPHGNIVAPGEEGGVPHNTGTRERVLRAHESLVVDLYPKGGLFADCTRTFCVGEPPPALAAAHADVLAALLAAHAATRAGARGWDLQRATCELLAARGHETPITHPGTVVGYVHGLGHGVGYELHEYPSFRQFVAEEGLLEVGDVVTLEPGIYRPGPDGFGVRLEDLAVVEADGLANLTPLPYDLDPRAWPA